MQVVIRADASIQIGTGHVMRCLTLANKLRQKGAFVQFISREHPGHLCNHIEQQGFIVHRLSPPLQPNETNDKKSSYEQWLGVSWELDVEQTLSALRKTHVPMDLMIVDHYAIDIKWEQRIRQHVDKIMVIDDLANRGHDCDILLDQNLYEHMDERYKELVPDRCLQLLGPRYALLREEFRAAQKQAKIRDQAIQRVLVFFGGSDPTNETEKALQAITLLDEKYITFDVVVGNSNVNREHIEILCSKLPNVNYYCQINYIAKLMTQADLSIGAGGSTTWERCVLGLPAITITTADNQMEVTEAVAKAGAVLYLGHYRNITPITIADAIKHMLSNPQLLTRMSAASMDLMEKQPSDSAAGVVEAIYGSQRQK
ncbi:UDP-2,4-diacetamido-2,4,6-trideoxy-beta-L-altropyranose hydrolase [Paenibacillus filicis]|uniref:UDP-2,4-diacetamido-2,4, 6-trideoxy-beta-L-altropyranose hydrolase n=1 Tax=Paenibacillus gyeongsangnamensis TaxID=3388067 RepID=A0ABT4QDG7_9BACL|nr:UDP-2,4-diacetamido-2,4,6-trideoxy-beta-L-altropyranose hydrolase [Paenibacillus filicis]MCZ8514889.1 UDP-2,4-diacetamido-2,4,6-trideoxy-beta-L-altropyranose hydrolase [Paenibacillus filicis]